MIEGKSATRNKIIFVICYTSNNNEMLKRKQDELMHACYVMFVIYARLFLTHLLKVRKIVNSLYRLHVVYSDQLMGAAHYSLYT